jgi:membrane-bound metal-dependent hydrolase YbcI (DUF457 family)
MKSTAMHNFAFVLLIAAALWFSYYSAHPQVAWLVSMACVGAICIVLGLWIMKMPLGILISNQNLMSLSRLQLVMWTLIIFSGYLVILMQRILHHVYNPLEISIDNNLWAVLGISTASFVATPLVLGQKAQSNASAQAVTAAGLALNEDPAQIQSNAQGTLYVNPSPQDASITDMFQGDEIGNTAYVDISKVQMFLLTIFVVAAYGNDLYHLLAGFDVSAVRGDFAALDRLPVLSSSEVKLVGLSHAGYLGFKAVGHTN